MKKANEALLSVEDLKVYYRKNAAPVQEDEHWIKAVDGVSFEISKRQTFGLVGESGSGKSTVARAIVGLAPMFAGSIHFQGQPHLGGEAKDGQLGWRKRIQMIFQDPNHTLNPRHTVGSILEEPLKIHFKSMNRSDRRDRIEELLSAVGLDADAMRRYPHQFSGGQRQRIGIARAMSVDPELVICDEVVSALDVSVQAQIINLLQDLQEQRGCAYLFIAHDLAVIEHISDWVAVMKQGCIVESGSPESIYHTPREPYTQNLLNAVPKLPSLSGQSA